MTERAVNLRIGDDKPKTAGTGGGETDMSVLGETFTISNNLEWVELGFKLKPGGGTCSYRLSNRKKTVPLGRRGGS